jgi:hypothetical protein
MPCPKTVESLNSIPNVRGAIPPPRGRQWNRKVHDTAKYMLTVVIVGLVVASAFR